ncbi:MAG: L-histidine N(alpha)-methyltransferase, partial [Balneolaceae bacterium]|nr:L-histidine N(alpha)-methyltransferase [Balneolaceae bacterium]
MSQPVSKVASTDFYQDVVDGLTNDQKSIPSKYFYDEPGSELFEEICKLDEYYLTRAELDLMETHIWEICSTIGRNALLVELGSGSSLKTRLLLRNLEEPVAYIPVDISSDFLEKTAESLRKEFDGLSVFPVSADYTNSFQIPLREEAEKTVLYYPGSTIGNFTQKNASLFLKRMAERL